MEPSDKPLIHAFVKEPSENEGKPKIDESTESSNTSDSSDSSNCKNCRRKFSRHQSFCRKNRSRKKLVEKRKSKFECYICMRDFNSERGTSQHLNSHRFLVNNRINDSFKCKKCKKTFKTNINLENHIKIVHSLKREFNCKDCDWTFKKRSDLKHHKVRKHSDLRPFKCLKCDTAFKTKKDLNKHQNVHSELRPYKCTICGNAYKTKSALAEHLLTHSNDKPFKCEFALCDSAFKIKRFLKKHVSMVHLQKKPKVGVKKKTD